ncbi:YDG domain-containing protein [Cardamine amara subsp. amara]|uniref:YDG domain-containing protein n=1 Tax=Cardamine amara subsp. amara TaxID=228776 RepID=A0ABD1BAQ0_CARAN
MNQKSSASDKQQKVSASDKGNNVIGSGDNKCVGVADHSNHRPKEAESRAGFKGNVGSDPVMRNFNPPRGSKIKLVSSEESEKLLASQSRRRYVPVQIQKKLLVVNAVIKKKVSTADASRLKENARKPTQHRDEIRSNQRGLVRVPEGRVNAAFKNHPIRRVAQEPADQHRDRVNAAFKNHPIRRVEQDQDRVNAAFKNPPIRRVAQESADQDQDHVVAVPRPNGQEREIRNAGYDPTAREKVLEVLHFFKQVYKRLNREKEERRGGDLFNATDRIDIKTLDVIENMGKRVNVEMRIGSVPGIKVGDEFQYKTQLRAVGLHSKPMCGIDYMKVGDMKFATSITASEGYGYNDKFDSGFLVYTGEGGNVISKEKKTENQKLNKGNLALANSLRYKKEVRVIRGEERWDRKGKRYTYFGLYLVENYWTEIKDRGKVVYKFKLFRIPGQPPLT